MRLPAALLLPSILLLVSSAASQTQSPDPDSSEAPAKESTARASEDASTSESAALPLAEDTLRGRFALSLMGGAFAPFGSLEKEIPWSRVSKPGPGADLEAAVGVSRSAALGAWLHTSRFGSGSVCETCSTTTLAGGPLLRLHLVQGLKLDPWVSIGVGLRAIAIHSDRDTSYRGFDFARLTVGGDWYASRNVAVGPYVQLLSGVTVERPASPPAGERPFDDRGSVYWIFSSGLRLTLSLPGR